MANPAMKRVFGGRLVRRPFLAGDKELHHSCRRSVSLSEVGFRGGSMSGGSCAISTGKRPPWVSTQELAPRF